MLIWLVVAERTDLNLEIGMDVVVGMDVEEDTGVKVRARSIVHSTENMECLGHFAL